MRVCVRAREEKTEDKDLYIREGKGNCFCVTHTIPATVEQPEHRNQAGNSEEREEKELEECEGVD